MEPLTFLLNISGLISAVSISAGFSWCWTTNKFNLRKNTLSDSGNSRKTSAIFAFSLIMFGILQVIFTLAIMRKYTLFNHFWLVLPAIFAALLMVGDAILNNRTFRKIHGFFGLGIFLTLIPWSLVFGYYILKVEIPVGFISLVISAILGLGTFISYLRYGACAIPEIFFVGGVVVWNLFFTYALFFV